MLDLEGFREWLKSNTTYSENVIGNTVSRMKRADSILEWDGNKAYIFFLCETDEFAALSTSVRSQLRKAVKLYQSFSKSQSE